MTGTLATIILAACKPVSDDRLVPDRKAADRGRAIAVRAQCAACHVMPGIDWPKGRLGPALDRYPDRGLVAGTLPNTPANLAAFIRNAPAVKPGTGMPAMNLSDEDARAIAHFLLVEGQR